MEGEVLTLADIKNYLGITTADKDTALSAVLLGAEELIRSYIGRKLASSEYTELVDGAGQRKLVLKNMPVTALTSFQYNTGTLSNPVWTNIATDTYVLNASSGIIMLTTPLIRGLQNIKVVYTAGYEELPADVSLALYKLVDMLRQEKGVEGIVSEKADDVSVQYSSRSELPQTIRIALDKYKRYV